MKIYNSLTKEKEHFKPLKENHVSIYACGVTVYDYFHIGNARMMIVFDMIVRYFRFCGFDVTYVQNITDIDDKIIKRAQEQHVNFDVVTAKYIQALYEDQTALGLLPPDQAPRATEFVEKMIVMISQLIEDDYAYLSKNGDILFHIEKFKDYGKLSHRKLEDLQAGSRVEVDEDKKSPLDFVLWKTAKPGEPFWESPWGKGRPGWHIECSVMAEYCLGKQIDIHGGGMDLKFPHHENEIAQTESCTKKPFAQIWMHVGFLQINDEKMSKSLGNFFLAREVLEQYHPEAIRYFMLSAHYRQPINYSLENLSNANLALQRFYLSLRDLEKKAEPMMKTDYEAAFHEAMKDDFNTPEAMSVLFELTREINRLKLVDMEAASTLGALLKKLAGSMGLLQCDPDQFLQGKEEDQVDAEKIEVLIAARDQARAAKNWAEADRIRKILDEMNIVLEDSNQKTLWRHKR